MQYELSWRVTFVVFVVAIALGIGSSALIRDGAVRTIWATIISVIFIASAGASVLFSYSWVFTETSRMVAQSLALGSLLTGITYTMRAPS